MAETIAVLGVGPSRGLGAAIARRFAAGEPLRNVVDKKNWF